MRPLAGILAGALVAIAATGCRRSELLPAPPVAAVEPAPAPAQASVPAPAPPPGPPGRVAPPSPRPVRPSSALHVIPAGQDAVFQAIAAAPYPAGWTVEAVSVRFVSVDLRFGRTGGRPVEVDLVHPAGATAPLATTAKFAVVAHDAAAAPPPDLVAAVAAAVRGAEGPFRWERRVRPDAVPVHQLNRPHLEPKAPAAAAAYREGLSLAATGRTAEALARADTVAAAAGTDAAALRAAAHLFRVAGDGNRAGALLDRMRTTGTEDPDDLRIRLEKAAARELKGDRAGAAALLDAVARDYARLYPHRACARADALTVLLQDGLKGRVELLARGGNGFPSCDAKGACTWPAGAPRCVFLLRLKAADAADDDAAVDREAKAALERFPDDPDVLFLWGTHYYAKRSLERALDAWDRLAPLQPDYPTLIGQYGTALLVAKHLLPAEIRVYQDRLKADPDDLMSNYLAGLGLYYQHDYKAVVPLLEKAVAGVPDEARARMYLAMARFFSGDRETALREIEALDGFAYQEPDIYYCRSLLYRSFDLPRAIREMEKFIEVFEGENRLRFGQQKVTKARSDLEAMRRGEVPPVDLGPVEHEDPK